MCPVITCRQHNLDPPKGKGHTCVELVLPDGTTMALAASDKKGRDDWKTEERRRYQYTFAWLETRPIVEQAQALRPGHTCTLAVPSLDDLFKDDMWPSSNMNVHLPLAFDDGVRWMVRARQWRASSPPAELQKQATESEVVTLQFLKKGGVKVPMAWMPPKLSHEDDARSTAGEAVIDYFFMEFIEGSALFVNPLTDKLTASPVVDQFIEDLAHYFITISNTAVPARGIGSLYRKEDGTFTVGPLCTVGYLMDPHPPYFLGPFKTQMERYITHFDHALDYVYLFASDYGIEQIQVYMWLAEVRELVMGCAELKREETEFYIKHGDDWLRQYFSDERGKITGVLDWEWAFVTTKAEAFSLPRNMYLDASGTSLADNSPTPAELLLISALERQNRTDLADCVRQARLYQRLKGALTCGGYPPTTSDINDLRQLILGEKAGKPWETLAHWEMATVEKYKEDPRLVDLAWRIYIDTKRRVKSPVVLMLVREKLEEEKRQSEEGGGAAEPNGGDGRDVARRWVRPAFECFQK
ncbi:hypothetical protein IAT38_003557 [Cryptococcus sp. DSM 104549]